MFASINIRIDQEVEELWQKFNKITTEMVIAKGGRKPFPNFDFQVVGLEPEHSYIILLKMKHIDQKRYRYTESNGKSSWHGVAVQKSEECEDAVIHQDEIQKGSEWMENFFSFENVKFTNCKNNKKDNQFYLQSMHKYRPHLEIYHIQEQEQNDQKTKTFEEIKEKVLIYSRGFELMDFIAVTRYQNEEVIKLKKETNKYASGHLSKQKQTKMEAQQQTATPPTMGFSPEFNHLSQQPQNCFNQNIAYNSLNFNQFEVNPFMNQPMMMAYMMNQWQIQQTMQNQYQNGQFTPMAHNNYNHMSGPSNFNMNYPTPTMSPQTNSNTAAPQFQPNKHGGLLTNVNTVIYPAVGSLQNQIKQMHVAPTSIGYLTPNVSCPNSAYPGSTTAHTQPNPSLITEELVNRNFQPINNFVSSNMSFGNQTNPNNQKMPDFRY